MFVSPPAHPSMAPALPAMPPVIPGAVPFGLPDHQNTASQGNAAALNPDFPHTLIIPDAHSFCSYQCPLAAGLGCSQGSHQQKKVARAALLADYRQLTPAQQKEWRASRGVGQREMDAALRASYPQVSNAARWCDTLDDPAAVSGCRYGVRREQEAQSHELADDLQRLDPAQRQAWRQRRGFAADADIHPFGQPRRAGLPPAPSLETSVARHLHMWTPDEPDIPATPPPRRDEM